MFGTHAEDVEGFTYSDSGDAHDGEVVQIVARVRDWPFLSAEGPAFFIRFPSSEVVVAVASTLRPWFPI